VLELRPDDEMAKRNRAVAVKKSEAKRAMQTLRN
jgi:hypothetical protein